MSEKTNIVKAINKNVRSGARKANLVLNFIKGKKADIAIRDLEFTRKKVAEDIKKTVIHNLFTRNKLASCSRVPSWCANKCY